MNITNNPYYNCVTSATNPYLNTVTFKSAPTPLTKQMQITFLLDRLSKVTDTVPYILTVGGGKPAPFYIKIMNEVSASPTKYNCTQQELRNAYGITLEIIQNISSSYNKTKTINEAVLKYGVTVLNDRFFEDACDDKINFVFFVDGMKRMAADLNKYRKILLQ